MSLLEKVRPEPQLTVRKEPRVTDEHGRRVRVGELVWRYLLLLAVLALTVGPFLWQ
ncbi:carbohydrate ABC transporter permease, partial [Streptomyces sp. NPDC001792]